LDQNGLRVAHPSTGGQRVDSRTLDRGLEGEVEILEGLANWQIGQSKRRLHPPCLAAGEFGLQQRLQKSVRGHLGAHRFAQDMVELLGRIAAAKRHKPLSGRIDIELRPGSVHRATSASAA
jgi:hypothetical protein